MEHRGCIECPLISTALLLGLLATGCADSSGAFDVRNLAPEAARIQTADPGEPAAVAGITEAHNRVRARVGVPPLRWNPVLAATARRWANACVDVVAPRGMLDHSPITDEADAEPIGENIFATTAAVVDPRFAVEDWASEAVYYDHDRNVCSGGACGHYTQLVWSTTREVGCGVGSCPNLKFRSTLVCNYAPAGNWIGERPYP